MAIYVYNCDLREFDAAQIIAQQCNCVTTTAKGLSASIAERFPYADFYRDNPNRVPGTIEIRGGDDATRKRWICAMYAQYHPGKATGKDGDTIERRKRWFTECLGRIARIKNLRSVAFPRKIGCGLAGGDWSIYRALIDEWVPTLTDGVKVYLVSNECFEDKILEMEGATTTKAVVATSTPPTVISYATMTLLEFTTKHFPSSWSEFVKRVLDGGYVEDVSKFLAAEAKAGKVIFPPLPLVYNVFSRVAPKDIRVVIIGQDCYHGEGQAMGISFSVDRKHPAPPSLKNIYREMTEDGFTVANEACGDLSKWCQQGVFLINVCLTVRQGEAGSHLGTATKRETNKWWYFTSQLFSYINYNCKGVVVIMWGTPARCYSDCFDDIKHRKITSVHPSPLSASGGFFGSKPFSKANKLLKELGHKPVDWSL